MSDDERKPRVHIHTGGLIILIILLFILFKVDLVSKVKSPQFQENITFVKTEATKFWNDYVVFPMKSSSGEWLKNTVNNTVNGGLEKVQNNLSEKINKTDEINQLNN
jgi:hypothetical protein